METEKLSPNSTQEHQIIFLKQAIQEQSLLFQQIRTEIKHVIIGHEETINLILMSILCDGHVLLEGLPGVAKTTLVKTVAEILGLNFKRIQFTPDLLPADLIGTMVYNQKTTDFEARKGPLFAHIILADEINRAPAKVQSALLEAMQEQQVTIGSTTYALQKPFLVFATQNPIEQEGTYTLPEAQVDRFLFKLQMPYPTREQEKQLLFALQTNKVCCQPISPETLAKSRELMASIYVDPLIVDYITRLVDATRNPENYNLMHLKGYIQHGASPRATLGLFAAARAAAFLAQRHFVIPDDIKRVACVILQHRIKLSFEAEAEGLQPHTIALQILEQVKTP
ncbi:MAG: ATPase associated with various cellular activity [candidate division TM6 bacterium GW2011_GWE2_42_60]|nr:MAG: ATPase associated with various cellular activity [candidate division TM6 bacterium GW2011_GWE2_42_60]HBY05822.1 ATPase [Candidatus Dependentiae bacterium]